MNKIIHIEPLYSDLMVHFGSPKSLRKELKRYVDESVIKRVYDDNEFNGKKALTYMNQDCGVFFVWMPNKPSTAEDLGFLVHELFHAVVEMCEIIGAELVSQSQEFYAYLIGYLTERVITDCKISLSCPVQ